jgi:phage terminase large subunit-like protein
MMLKLDNLVAIIYPLCTRKGVNWTQQAEDLWVESLYKKYGVGASQELDCIPSDDAGLGLFKNPRFVMSHYTDTYGRFLVRSWDLAATEKDGCYSVGSLISYSATDKLFIVEDIKAGQWNPIEGDKILVSTAKDDGFQTHLLIEQEGGSEALRWRQYIENQLSGHYVDFKRPETNKLSRAVPLANAIMNGELVFLDTPNNREMAAQLLKFSEKSKPLVTDLVDSLSQGYSYLRSMFFDTGMLGT